MAMATTTLRDKAMLVKFTDHVWIGGTIDRKVGKEIEAAAGATQNTGHYWKRLIPKAALNKRINIGSDARLFHYTNTLPWMEGGIRILPAANFADYMAGMRKRQTAAVTADRQFFAEYQSWIDEAKRVQGTLFNEHDYPSADQIKGKFGFEIDVVPLPNIADWRVDLGEEQVTELRREAEQKFALLQTEGLTELYKRIQQALEHAQERLGDDKAIFRDSLVDNIKTICRQVANLNVTGDKGLEIVRKETEEKLAGLMPNTLRTDPVARSKAANDAREIMRKMSSFMGGAKPLPEPEAPAEKIETRQERKNRQARERRAAKNGKK